MISALFLAGFAMAVGTSPTDVSINQACQACDHYPCAEKPWRRAIARGLSAQHDHVPHFDFSALLGTSCERVSAVHPMWWARFSAMKPVSRCFSDSLG